MPPTIAHYNDDLIWHPEIRPLPKVGRHPPLWHPAMATQQWHHVHYPEVGAMAPRPLPQSWSSPSPLAPYNGTTPTTPKLVVTLPSGTLQWHPATAPRPLPQTSPPTIAHYNGTPPIAPSNGTTSSAPCTGTLVPRPIRQSGSSPSPPFGIIPA